MADAELVLRFFALRDAVVNNRRGSLRRILDRYMKEKVHIDEAEVVSLEDEYRALIGRLFEIFDHAPFRLPNGRRPSRPLYDALMIALSQNQEADIESEKDYVQERLNSALDQSNSYEILVGRGNTIDAIHDRVRLAEHILLGGNVS
jgi:hypothetical protein